MSYITFAQFYLCYFMLFIAVVANSVPKGKTSSKSSEFWVIAKNRQMYVVRNLPLTRMLSLDFPLLPILNSLRIDTYSSCLLFILYNTKGIY